MGRGREPSTHTGLILVLVVTMGEPEPDYQIAKEIPLP